MAHGVPKQKPTWPTLCVTKIKDFWFHAGSNTIAAAWRPSIEEGFPRRQIINDVVEEVGAIDEVITKKWQGWAPHNTHVSNSALEEACQSRGVTLPNSSKPVTTFQDRVLQYSILNAIQGINSLHSVRERSTLYKHPVTPFEWGLQEKAVE